MDTREHTQDSTGRPLRSTMAAESVGQSGNGSDKGRLPTSICLGYGLGSLATGMFGTVPGLILLYFMTDVLGVPAGLAGSAVFLPKFFDVFADPLVGMFSDRTRSTWGRRRPWLLLGSVVMPLSFFFMFSVPTFESIGTTFWYVTVLFLLASFGYSFFQVPYVAMPAEMTPLPHERTRVVSFRMVFMTVGILMGGALAPMLAKQGGGGRTGYTFMAIVLGLICFASMLGSFWGTRRAPFSAAVESQESLFTQLQQAYRCRSFRVLAFGSVMQFVGVSCMLATVPFYVRYVLNQGQEVVTVLFVSLMLPAVLTMPVWLWISRRLGKRRAYLLSLGLLGFLNTSFLLGPSIPLPLLYALTVLMGCAYAATQLLPFSMLTDVIQVENQRSGKAQEGIFTGLWTAVEKTGYAGGALVAGVILDQVGFKETRAGEAVVQSATAISGIVWDMGAVPALLLLAGLPVLWAYDIDERELSASVPVSH